LCGKFETGRVGLKTGFLEILGNVVLGFMMDGYFMVFAALF